MNPEPGCKVKFDPNTGKFAEIRFFGPRSNERKEQERVAVNCVERITKQLECPHGLTNKEKQRLHKELRQLKAFVRKTWIDETAEAKEQRKLKAAEKKLRRRVRKAERGTGVVDAVG